MMEKMEMANIIKKLNMSLIDDPASLVERNFLSYLAWPKNVSTLNRYVLDPFKESVLKKTGYSEDNIPSEEVTTAVIVDGLELMVKTTPTTKNKPYKTVLDELDNYLYVLLEKQYKEDIRRKDIITIHDEPYVCVADVLRVIEEKQEPLVKPAINQSLILPEGLSDHDPGMVSIALDRDYSLLNEYNARAYATMFDFISNGNACAKIFKDAIYKDTLEALGKAPEDIDKIVSCSYPFGGVEFLHQIEPRESVKYAQILNALIKEAPETLKKNSKIGDLHLASMCCDGQSDTLEEKGLIDASFREAYSPKRREDRVYVRLKGLIDRVKHHTKENTSNIVERNLYMRPVC